MIARARRHGEDMTGDGRKKSNWNRALLLDAAAPAYARLLCEARMGAGLGGGAPDTGTYFGLWPASLPAREPWAEFVKAVYARASPLPLLLARGGGGGGAGGGAASPAAAATAGVWMACRYDSPWRVRACWRDLRHMHLCVFLFFSVFCAAA